MPTNPATDAERVHIWVTGRVQGVGFRSFVHSTATVFGLNGWVRNVDYNTVEAMAEGPRPLLDEFVDALKTGPSASHVDEAKVEWEQATGEFTEFRVRSSR